MGGYVRSSGPLTFLVVLNSGHLVPMDQPARALDIVYRWVGGWVGGWVGRFHSFIHSFLLPLHTHNPPTHPPTLFSQ